MCAPKHFYRLLACTSWGVQVGKKMKQVSISHMDQEGLHPIPPGLTLEVKWCPCRVSILLATKVPTTETVGHKIVLPTSRCCKLPCFINKPESCSQHIKVNRDASRVGNASNSNR